MISGGGATACHIADMARIVGIRRFLVPKLAAGLSAYGGLLSDLRWEETGTLHTDSRDFQAEAVEALLASLVARGRAFLDRAGVAPAARAYSFAFQGRYLYQSWDIEVTFDRGEKGLTKTDLAPLLAAFHAQHERIYTIKDTQEVVEFTTWKVRAIGDIGAGRRLARRLEPQVGAVPVARERAVYLGGHPIFLPVYDGLRIGADARIEGPALIEETTTTLLVLERQTATTDVYGNYHVEAVS